MREVSPGKCLPIYAKTDSEGNINLAFNHPIVFKIDKDDLMAEVMASGAIQFQLVTATKPESEESIAFTWEMDIVNDNTLQFEITWADPEAISSSGIDKDSIRIYLEDTASIISCVEGSGTSLGRMLQDSVFSIPEQTILRIELPPQHLPTASGAVANSIINIEDSDEATDVLFLGVGLSTILGVPSQVLYDGILAL